jgi:O-antigen ligase
MNYKYWWKWFKSLPISKSWFVILILIRPIIDNFYELKETSALASPLYIVGILTPVFIVMSLLSNELGKKHDAIEEFPFRMWSILLVFNAVVFWFIQLNVNAFGDLVKYITPVFLFLYARRFVQSREDLHGILTSFLLSCIFPLGIFLYEVFFNPIAIEYISAGRGGASRIRGAYADVMSYAIYFILFLLTMAYYFLLNLYKGAGNIRINNTLLIGSAVLIFFALTRINHVSTWGVFLAIIGLFFAHNLKSAKGFFLVVFATLIISVFFAQDIYRDFIEPLISKELLVVSGESETNQAFNGRMTRWERYFETWEQMPAINHFFGIVSANFKETVVMIGGGMHSDYVRLLFMTGFAGLGFYIIFLVGILGKWFGLEMPEKFLVSTSVIMIILWSITTVPTLYAPLLYIIYPIYAYSLLPKERQ